MALQFLDIRPGVVDDATSFAVGSGGYIDASNVRFLNGFPEVIGGWERLTLSQASGVPRAVLDWKDNAGELNIAVGTHTKLYVEKDGFFDITPAEFVAGRADNLGGAGYNIGTYDTGAYGEPSATDYFALTWSLAPYGQTLLANPREQTLFQWSNDTSAVAVSLGRTAHLTDELTYADQTAADAVWTRGTGWTLDAANDQFDCDGSQGSNSDLTRSVTGLTVGARYRVTAAYSGRTAGTVKALAGSATGDASEGADGEVFVAFVASSTSATVGLRADSDFIGSMDADFVVYELSAPDKIKFISVPENKRHCIAYGCNEELSDVFNPRCIRVCDFEDLTDWTTNSNDNVDEVILDSAGGLVGALEAGRSAFVWTDTEVFQRRFVGAPTQVYAFDRVGSGCGLIGPNGSAQLGVYAYWMGPDVQIWRCSPGGSPEPVPCPLISEVKDNLDTVQAEKVFAVTVTEFQEVRWHYVDLRDEGKECSRYISLNVQDGVWSKGELSRTAANDAGPATYPIMASADGDLFWHEKGNSADGGVISARLETGDIYIARGDQNMMVTEVRPDFQNQIGALSLTVSGRQYPQGTPIEEGPLTVTSLTDKVNCRVTGRMVRFKWESSSAPSSWRMGRISIRVQPRGRR